MKTPQGYNSNPALCSLTRVSDVAQPVRRLLHRFVRLGLTDRMTRASSLDQIEPGSAEFRFSETLGFLGVWAVGLVRLSPAHRIIPFTSYPGPLIGGQ